MVGLNENLTFKQLLENITLIKISSGMVELRGIEPLTSSLRTTRSPS